MAIKIIEGFENRTEWYGVGDAANVASTNQSLSGDAAVTFDKAAGTEDFAGIAKVFNGLDLTDPSYQRLFVSVYIPPAVIDAGSLTSIDVVLDDSATDNDAYPVYENTYECNAKPTLATPAWTQTLGGVDVTTVGGGAISWQAAHQRFYQDLASIFEWIDAGNVYRCAKVRWRNMLETGTIDDRVEVRVRNGYGQFVRCIVRDGFVKYNNVSFAIPNNIPNWYTGETYLDRIDGGGSTQLLLNDVAVTQQPPLAGGSIGIEFGDITSLNLKAQFYDFFRWTRYVTGTVMKVYRYPIADLSAGWNELQIDLSVTPSFNLGTVDPANLTRMGFVANTLGLGAVEGIVFDELAAETPKEYQERPVVLLDWTQTEDVVEGFEDLSPVVVEGFEELADWAPTNIDLSLNTGNKTQGLASLQMDKTTLATATGSASNSLEIPLDTRNYTKGAVDYFVPVDPSDGQIKVSSIAIFISSGGVNVGDETFSGTFTEGWNTLTFDLHRNVGFIYPNALQAAFADTINLSITALNPVTQIFGFLWDNLRFFGGFDPFNADTTGLTEETSIITEGTAAQQFNKTGGDIEAGVQKYSAQSQNMTLFRDELDLDVYLSSEADAAKVDKFRVVLDETEWYARWNLFRDWFRKWDGSVKPINEPLLEDFESAAAWTTTDPGVTLGNNTVQFTEGTQSVNMDIAAGATNLVASMDKANVFSLRDYSSLTVDVYIPVAELSKVLTLQMILEDSSADTATWNLAKIANWNTNILDPLSPDLVDANFDFTDVAKIRFKYTVHGSTSVTGLSFDNMRVVDNDTWSLGGVDHWTVIGGEQLQCSLNNTDLSYFETPLDLIPNRDGIWISSEVYVDAGLTNLATGIQIARDGTLTDIQWNASTLYVSNDAGTYDNIAVDFTSPNNRWFIINVRGSDGRIRIWFGDTLIFEGNRSGISSTGNFIRFGKISTLQSAHNAYFDSFKVWYDQTDNEEPWRLQYEADYLPNSASSDPFWFVFGTTPTHSIVSGVLNVSFPTAAGYYQLNDNVASNPKLPEITRWGGAGGKETLLVSFQHPGGGVDPFDFWFISPLGTGDQRALFRIGDGFIRIGGQEAGNMTQFATSTTGALRQYLVEVQWGVDIGGNLSDGFIRAWAVTPGSLIGQHDNLSTTIASPSNKFSFGKIIGSTPSAAVYLLDDLYLSHGVTNKSVYEIDATSSGWNTVSIEQDDPTSTVGSPSREAVTGLQFTLDTNNITDTLTGVVFDNFREDYVLHLAKHDFIAGDGSIRWEGRVLSFGNLSKSLNETIGNYSVSNAGIELENASGFFGQLYDAEGLKLANTTLEFRHGDLDDDFSNFPRLFRGTVGTINFSQYSVSADATDALPGLFNRLPNQYARTESFPDVPADQKDYVGAIVAGVVSDPGGALPAIPVDFNITIEANRNDWIDFKLIVSGSSASDPTQYSAQIAAGVYSDPLVLAQAAATAMNNAILPNQAHFTGTIDSEERKITINRIKQPDPADPDNEIPLGDQFEINWGDGPKSGYSAARSLGFKKENKGGSDEIKAEHAAWNVYVVARHPTQDPTFVAGAADLDAAVWINDGIESNEFVGYYAKGVLVTAGSNDKIDYTDDDGTFVATVAPGNYLEPSDLAAAIKTAMEATGTTETYTVNYGGTFSNRFSIIADTSTLLTMPWATGPNNANSIGPSIGFTLDDISLTTYAANNEIFFRDEVTFNHNYESPDGLKWTLVTTNFICAGVTDIRVNCRGFTDDDTPTGDLVTNPIEALEIMLTRYVGFPVDNINQGRWQEGKDEADRRLLRVDGALIDDTEWDSFMEEYCKNFRFDIWPDNNGRLSVDFFAPEIADASAPALSDITDVLKGSFNYNTNFTEIINRVRYEYRYNFVDEKYRRSEIEQNDESIADSKRTYDWPEGTLQMKWVRDTVTARRTVSTVLDLFSNSNPVTEIKLARIGWEYDLTDKINLDHAAAPSTFPIAALGITARGFNSRLHRLTSIGYELDDYTTSLRYQDMFRLSSRCFFLGDRDWATSELNWLTASASNRLIYGYLCDRDTGVFGDGEPGKRLC